MHVFVGLGSNLGDRHIALANARTALSGVMTVIACSPIYTTPPWGIHEQPPFLNAVCHGTTALAPHLLLASLKQIERTLGRVPSYRWGPRALDLDLLFYDNLVLDTPDLTLPHPLLHERAFVLRPLSDLAPDLLHPRLHRTVAELLSTVDDSTITVAPQQWSV